MQGVVIRRGTSAVQPAPTSPLEIGIVGTAASDKASGTAFGTVYRVNSVAEAEVTFGKATAGTPARTGTIVEAMKAIEEHVRVPVHAVAIDVTAGLDASSVRNAINAAVALLPTTCTYIAAPMLTVNYDGTGNVLTTVCSTVAALQTRANQIDAIAVTDTAWESLADAIAYLGGAGNLGTRIMPVAPRVYKTDGLPHSAAAAALGAMARNEIDNGVARTPSNIPVFGVVRQEVEMLRSRTDTTAGANQILNAGGSVIAYSNGTWRLFGAKLGGTTATIPERFVSVRRVVDEAEARLERVLSPYEDANLEGDAIGIIVDAADGELSRMRASNMFGGYTVAPNAEYNVQSNLAAGQVGIAVTLEVYTPIGLIDVLLNLATSTPTA